MTTKTAATGIDRALLTAAAGGSAVVGGVFAGFSGIVMPAVLTLPTAQAIQTMQRLNQAALRPPFMVPFMGTAVLSAGIAVRELARRRERRSPAALAGSLLYLATFALTAVYHVPRNDRLQSMPADSAQAEAYWNANVAGWCRMNDVRALTALAAAAAFAAAVRGR